MDQLDEAILIFLPYLFNVFKHEEELALLLPRAISLPIPVCNYLVRPLLLEKAAQTHRLLIRMRLAVLVEIVVRNVREVGILVQDCILFLAPQLLDDRASNLFEELRC